jgi:hypothetical protein
MVCLCSWLGTGKMVWTPADMGCTDFRGFQHVRLALIKSSRSLSASCSDNDDELLNVLFFQCAR